MDGEQPLAWGIFVGLTALFVIFPLRLKILFICAAVIVTVSAVLAMLITMDRIIPALEDWQVVFDLGRYAFFFLLSALVLIIIRHIREGGEDINRGGQKED